MVAIDTSRALSPRIANIVISAVLNVVETVSEWRNARETRKTLESLTDAELRDIGVSRSEIIAISRGLVR